MALIFLTTQEPAYTADSLHRWRFLMHTDFADEQDTLVSRLQTKVLESEVIKIKYPVLRTKLCYISNSKTLDDLLRNKTNVYALWRKKPSSNDWELMYLGQRKHRLTRTHLIHHFFKKPENVISQLPAIKKSLLDGYEIGISVLYAQPDEMYTVTNGYLISLMKRSQLCAWNTHLS